MVLHDKSNLRETLIDCAELCFENKGVAHTSMLDIAEQAGVSRTSLYKYYPRIDDVLKAAFTREFDRFEAKITSLLARLPGPEARLLETVVGIAENVPKSTWIGALVSGPRTRTEEKALRVGRQALDARIQAMLKAPLMDLAKADRLREDVGTEQIVEWLRIQIHAFSVLRHPNPGAIHSRRQLMTEFVLPSVLKPVGD